MENFGPRRSRRSEHVAQWFIPKNEETKEMFERGRADVKSVLLTSKEGMKVGSIKNFLDSNGLSIKFLELGFNNFNEFLFHCSDFIDVRMYPPNSGYLPNTNKYLFLRPSAVDANSEHVLKLVQAQHADKKRKDGRPRPTLKNLVYAAPESLLDNVPRYSYNESSENASGPSNGAGRGRSQSSSRGFPLGHWRGGGASSRGVGAYSRGGGASGRGGSVPASRPASTSFSAPRLQSSNAASSTSRNVTTPIRSLLSVGGPTSGFDCTDRVARNPGAGDGPRIQHNPPTPVILPTRSGCVERYYDTQHAPRPDPPASQRVSRNFRHADPPTSTPIQTRSGSYSFSGGLGPAEPTTPATPLRTEPAPIRKLVEIEDRAISTSVAAPAKVAPAPPPPSRYYEDDYDDSMSDSDEEEGFELMSGVAAGAPVAHPVVAVPRDETRELTVDVELVHGSGDGPEPVPIEQLMTNLSIQTTNDQAELPTIQPVSIQPIDAAILDVLDNLDPMLHYDPRKAILPDVDESNAGGALMNLTVCKYLEIETDLVLVKTMDRSSRQQLRNLESMMSGWYSKYFNEDHVPASDLVQNGVYAGFDNERMVWSRVQVDLTTVDEVDKNLIRAFLIDHGYTKMIDKNELGYLKPAHVHLKRQSFILSPTRFDYETAFVSPRIFKYQSTGKTYKFFIFPNSNDEKENMKPWNGIPVFKARFIHELNPEVDI